MDTFFLLIATKSIIQFPRVSDGIIRPTKIMKTGKLIIFTLITLLITSCDIGKNAEKLYAEATEAAKKGKVESAYKLFKKAAEKEPENVQYQWAAASTAPNQNEAFIHTKAAWDNGLKTPVVLLRLTTIAFHTSMDQKLDYALNLFKELPDSSRTPEFRGDIFSQFSKYDSSIAIFKQIDKLSPGPEIANKIALTYEKAGRLDDALEYLNNCRVDNRMNAAAYSMLLSLWALQYDYKQVDALFDEAISRGFTTDMLKLDYATVLINQGRLIDAQLYLNEVSQSQSAPSLVKLLASINQCYVLRQSNRHDDLKRLVLLENDTTGIVKIANEYKEYLLTSANDTTDALSKVLSIYKKTPQSFPLALGYARELARSKQFGKADTVYRQIPQAILLSPAVLPEFASNLVRLGKDDDAMRLVSNLHQHKIFNKSSLELFRDLSYKKNLIEKADAAQKLLEKSFRDDVGVLWSKGMIALRSGKYDSAYSVFSSLASAHPKESQFVIMKLNTRFLKGEYDAVISEALSPDVPVAFSKLISARAYRKIDKLDKAKAAYEELLALANDSIFEPYMEYAQFLLDCGESGKAVETFSKLITIYEKSPKKNDAGLAMILNNYAWSAAEIESFDKEQVVAAAKKAITLQPENTQIMDTYATVLMKAGMFKECAAVLKDNTLLKKEPSLLFHLGLAFEKSGDKNKAVRTYQEILATPDSLLGQNGKVKKARLADHLAELQK